MQLVSATQAGLSTTSRKSLFSFSFSFLMNIAV